MIAECGDGHITIKHSFERETQNITSNTMFLNGLKAVRAKEDSSCICDIIYI
jgi:hypothetical protein